MARHETTVHIAASEFERINRLLAIECFEDMTDRQLLEQAVKTDSCEGVFHAEFDDGSSIDFDLCSGQNNYWDDVVWRSPDGSHDVMLECAYKLDGIETEIEGELYIVKLSVDK